MSTTASLSLSDALTGFTLDLRAKGRAAKTVSAYTESVRALARWRTEQGQADDLLSLTRDEFKGFLVSLIDRGLTPATARARYASIRQLYRWLVTDGYLETDPTEGVSPPTLPKTPVPVLTDDELKLLLAEAERGGDFASRRDAAILRTFVSTGARLSEVAGLRLDDVDLDRGLVVFVTTKGDKPRTVGIGNRTSKALFRYLQARRENADAESEWLWLGRNGRFTSQGIAIMVKRRARDAGIERDVHAHMLRHSAAHRWLAGGGEEGDLMRIMGWSDRSMLDRYAAATAQGRALEAQRRLRLDDQF